MKQYEIEITKKARADPPSRPLLPQKQEGLLDGAARSVAYQTFLASCDLLNMDAINNNRRKGEGSLLKDHQVHGK